MKWQAVKGKANTKGRWIICPLCEGYGREMMYIGRPGCISCEGTGKLWREKSDRTFSPSEAKNVYGGHR
jgi:hypothetical protein